jgi:hypothetical protein
VALSVEQVRERVEARLSDEALGSLLADTYASIARELGPEGPLTEVLTGDAEDVLLLSRQPESIESVIENGIGLDEGDYALRGLLLLRLSTGPHPAQRWRGRPEITYTVLSDASERDRLAIALVKLELNTHPGVTSIKLGQFSETYAQGDNTYARERAAIFASYHGGDGGFI